MPQLSEEEEAVQHFLHAFNFTDKVDVGSVRNALFSQRQLNDVNASRDYVEQFIKKCERRDPTGIKPLKKRIDSVMAESEQMVYMMDFLIRCRQAHLFHNPSGAGSIAGGSSSPSMQSSPFQRRSASRTRVLSTLTGGDPPPQSSSESQRSRANSSFSSYDNRMIGIERQTMSSRAKSPFRIGHQGPEMIPTTRVSPLTASNHLFSVEFDDSQQLEYSDPSATYSSLATPTNPYRRPVEDPSSYVLQHRATPNKHLNNSITSTPITSSAAVVNPSSRTPLHARMGTAITHPEPLVCECLLKALLGIETPIFTLIHRKMAIASTASLSTSHTAVVQRVLPVADLFLLLSHREAPPPPGTVASALIAAIRFILGNYTVEIDALRRTKNLKMHQVLPLIDKWHCHLTLLAKAHRIRNIEALELLENLYVLHRSYSFDEERKAVLDTVLEYTMGVFCRQMMDWMTTGEVPDDKWMIRKDPQTENIFVKKIPVFMDESDARILLEIGKSLPHVESASDEDLAAIDKATIQVRAALTPAVIFKKELTPLLEILRDVVCGIVMRMVLTTGRLKEHLHKSTSFFFLTDPRFTITLYSIIKDASLGLRVGSASLSRQQVSSALASALEATTFEDNKKNKLKFTLDALTSFGNTPNVSSRMQFVQPLRPKYEPAMELMKPIFAAVDDDYEAIFHVIWAIDLARLSSEESAAHLPPIIRFLLKAYTLRENAWSLLDTISHVFYVINSTLTRVRSMIAMQVAYQFARFLAAVDERCVDMDDVIQEHRKFVRRVSVVTYVKNNEQIEQELSSLLRVSFEAQQFCDELTTTWNEILETTTEDENVRKAKVAECCQKRVLGARILLETVNKSQKKLSELLDHQITFGNEALIE